MKTGLRMWFGLPTCTQPSRGSPKLLSFCSSKQVAQGQSQVVSDTDLHESFSRDPQPIHPPPGFRQHPNRIQLAQQAHPKGELAGTRPS